MRTSKGADSLDMITPWSTSHLFCQYFMISLIYPKVYLYIQHIIYIIQLRGLCVLYKPASKGFEKILLNKLFKLSGTIFSWINLLLGLYAICRSYTHIQNVTVRFYTLKHYISPI